MIILVGSRKHLHCESLVTNWTPVQTQCKHKLPNPKMEQCDNSTYAHIVKSTTYNPGEFMPTISMSSHQKHRYNRSLINGAVNIFTNTWSSSLIHSLPL